MNVKQRFDSKWTPEPFSGCWLWTQGLFSKGYGEFKIHGQPTLAHRAAWTLYRGNVPEGMFVLHKCDTRSCVNPDHLFIGTQYDNIHDMIKKGRQIIVFSGMKNGNAKLSEQDVANIRRDNRTQRQIAKDYGIGQQQVCRIKTGQRWRHTYENA